MSEWVVRALSEVVALQRGHDLPTPQRRAGQVPVIGSFGVTGWHDKVKVSGPGVTIGRSGASIGTAVFVNDDYWPLNTCLYVTDFKGNNPRWVFHVLDLIDFSGYNSGSAQPSLNRNLLAQIPVAVPPIDEQERIASILGVFDGLIEINRRTADTVLELAMASFSRLEWSADIVPLSEVTTKIGSGATPRGGKSVYQQQGVSFIRSQNIQDGTFSFDGLAKISEAAAEALRSVAVVSGDVLINITGESVARTTLAPQRALPARVSQHVAIIRPDAALLDSRFLMLALLSNRVQAHLNGLSAAGATRRALTKAHLGATQIPLPPLATQQRVAGVLDAIHELEDEIADLTRTRDELLPLLMSGKIRIGEALEVA